MPNTNERGGVGGEKKINNKNPTQTDCEIMTLLRWSPMQGAVHEMHGLFYWIFF